MSLAHRFRLLLEHVSTWPLPPTPLLRSPSPTSFRVEKADATIKTFYTNLTPRFGELRYCRDVLYGRPTEEETKSEALVVQTKTQKRKKKIYIYNNINNNNPVVQYIDADAAVERRKMVGSNGKVRGGG